MLLFITLIFVLEIGYASWVDNAYGVKPHKHHHAIVIHAGNAATRLHLFHFRELIDGYRNTPPKDLELLTEYFDIVRPGLQVYADEPEEASYVIMDMLDNAAAFLEKDELNDTMIMFRATDWTERLPPESKDVMMEEITNVIMDSGFSDESNIGVLPEDEEGIYNWYSVNLLMGQLHNRGSTWGAVDMGGGATQLVFEVGRHRFMDRRTHFDVMVGDSVVKLLSHSYPGLGGESARLGAIRMEMDNNTATNLTTICLPPNIKNYKWIFRNKTYIITGLRHKSQTEANAFYHCYEIIRGYLLEMIDWRVPLHLSTRFAAVDNFFHYADHAGMIRQGNGKTDRYQYVKVKDFRSVAMKHYLREDNVQPWLCFGLLLAYSWLHDIYRFNDDDEILLLHTYQGIRTSWALGLAYSTLVDNVIKRDDETTTVKSEDDSVFKTEENEYEVEYYDDDETTPATSLLFRLRLE